MQNLTELLPIICEKHHLPQPNTITQLERGDVNRVFAVDEAYIIRFNLRDRHIKKFEREAIAYRVLNGRIPLPQLIAYDNDLDIVDCEVLILEKLPGSSLLTVWDNLSGQEKESAAFEAGKIMATIHQTEIGNGFGRLENRQFKTWAAYVENYVAGECAISGELGCMPRELQTAVEKRVSAATWLANVQTAQLIHRDYWFHNIHYHAGRINGVYDFEWATAGDPAFDLKDTIYLEDYNAGSKEPFTAGYRSIQPFPADFEQKSIFYQMLDEIELIPVAFQHWGQERFIEQVQNLKNLLTQLPS